MKGCRLWQSWYSFGGGIACGGSPIIESCIITNNRIDVDALVIDYDTYAAGGRIYCWGSPTLIGCTISYNKVRGWPCEFYWFHGTHVSGGGISYGSELWQEDDRVTVIDCVIYRNNAHGGPARVDSIHPKYQTNGNAYGGGIYGRATVTNSTICGNYAVGGGPDGCFGYPYLLEGDACGGGIYGLDGSIVTNCLVEDNEAGVSCNPGENRGGGIFGEGETVIDKCTLSHNWSTFGAEVEGTGYTTIITNSIVWDNDLRDGPDVNNCTATYCCIEDVYPGTGNIHVDPCYICLYYRDDNGTPEDANDDFWIHDYHLKSQAGRYDPTTQSWVYDEVTSPCIDAGNPLSPIGAEPFPNGGIVNMGAYEATEEASKYYFGKPPCEIIVAGDVNGDCLVNFLDFRLMTLHWCEDNSP